MIVFDFFDFLSVAKRRKNDNTPSQKLKFRECGTQRRQHKTNLYQIRNRYKASEEFKVCQFCCHGCSSFKGSSQNAWTYHKSHCRQSCQTEISQMFALKNLIPNSFFALLIFVSKSKVNKQVYNGALLCFTILWFLQFCPWLPKLLANFYH